MAAPKTPKPRKRTETPKFPSDGNFENLVDRIMTVVYNEKSNFTRDRMSKALECAKSRLDEFSGYSE